MKTILLAVTILLAISELTYWVMCSPMRIKRTGGLISRWRAAQAIEIETVKTRAI